MIQNPGNIARVGVEEHTKISAYYSSTQSFTEGLTVRKWLETQSFYEQYDFGLDILNRATSGASLPG